MDVANINGTGGVDRGSHRASRVDRTRDGSPRKETAKDSATISSDVRSTLESADDLAAKLRDQGVERGDRIDAARAKLHSGALDTPGAFLGAAFNLLDSL